MLTTKIGKTVAFIPIRGGSKSIPLKNIKKINGRPLVYWVLDATVNCDEIDKVIVSTDSDEINEVVSEYGSDKVEIIGRSKAVSTDTASTEAVMLEFALKYNFDDVILVQATSPLLKSQHIRDGIMKYNQESIDSVVSVVRQKKFIWEDSDLRSTPINYNPLNRPRRQEFEGFLVENGAFYITSRSRLLETKCRISGNIGTVEMPEESYFELDEPSDWIIIENMLKKSSNKVDIYEKVKNIKCLISDSDGVLTDGGMYYSESEGNIIKIIGYISDYIPIIDDINLELKE